ncbi:MAG: hypothetical protein ACP5QO_04255 [Clostridia bacterium]
MTDVLGPGRVGRRRWRALAMGLLYLLLVLAAAQFMGGTRSAALTAAAYAVAAVLVLTVEGWLRLGGSHPALLPEALSVAQSQRWVRMR